MNYEYFNAFLISYIIVACGVGRGLVNSTVKTVAVTENPCWSNTGGIFTMWVNLASIRGARFSTKAAQMLAGT